MKDEKMKTIYAIFLSIFLCLSTMGIAEDGAISSGSTGGMSGPIGPLSVAEEDLSPDTYPWRLKFPNGSILDNGDGTTSIDFVGGSLPTTYLKLDQTTHQHIINDYPRFDAGLGLVGNYGLYWRDVADANTVAYISYDGDLTMRAVTGDLILTAGGGDIGLTGNTDITGTLGAGVGTLTSLNLKDATNQIVLDSDGTYTGTITMETLAASRVYKFPTLAGTVATTASAPIALDATTGVISHASTAGNKHVPTGGSTKQVLRNSGVSGTAEWGTITDTAGAVANVTTLGMAGLLTNTINDAATNANTEMIRLSHTSSGTVAANFGASIDTYLEDASGNAAQQASSIATIWTTPTHGAESSAITFSEVTSGGAITEAMRIMGGNVGIGTMNPTDVLTLGATANQAIQVKTATDNAMFFGTYNDYGIFSINRNAGTGAWADINKAQSEFYLYGADGDSAIIFATSPTNNAYATIRMEINKDGNVGIGTTDLDGTPAIGRITVEGSTNNGSTNAQVWRDSDEANVATLDTNGVFTALGGLIIPSGTTPTPAVVGAIFLDTNASTNGDIVVYANGGWRKVISLP
jgi:hypothetical protein